MSTGFGPTSSAVGMFEPVTMTRSAVALAPGKEFPWASSTPAAAGAGDGTCAGTFKIMAKKIASRTAPLRNKPHSGIWILFIFVGFEPTNTQNACERSILFLLYFFICADAFIIPITNQHRNRHGEYSWCMLFGGAPRGTQETMFLISFCSLPRAHGANWHPIKNCVYSEDGNCC